MEGICLAENKLLGSLNLEHLPHTLLDLIVDQNGFCGTVNLTQLPGSLVNLVLCDNQLSGTVDVTKLPTNLHWLGISFNHFEEKQIFTPAKDVVETECDEYVAQRDNRT